MNKKAAIAIGIVAAVGIGAYLYLKERKPEYIVKAATTAEAASTPKCYCSPDQYQSIIVINNQRQMIPNADVYIDGKYVGKTATGITNMGMISHGFTPCQWHDVKVIACDGTIGRARLGFFCYPGRMDIWNVITVHTDKCGGPIGYAGP